MHIRGPLEVRWNHGRGKSDKVYVAENLYYLSSSNLNRACHICLFHNSCFVVQLQKWQMEHIYKYYTSGICS